jgi:hypothetical protein
MKTGMIVLTLLLCFVSAAVCFATDPWMGTWKLNEAKSKIAAGSPKNTTVVYEAAGDSVKVTVEGTTGEGKPVRMEWMGKFDGKYYPLTGSPTANERAYQRVDDHTLMMTSKRGDEVTRSVSIVRSADDKIFTVTGSGTDSNGNKYTQTAVYDKQ